MMLNRNHSNTSLNRLGNQSESALSSTGNLTATSAVEEDTLSPLSDGIAAAEGSSVYTGTATSDNTAVRKGKVGVDKKYIFLCIHKTILIIVCFFVLVFSSVKRYETAKERSG